MPDKQARTILNHDEHGQIPAYVILDCIFALTPSGTIIHHHREEFAEDNQGDDVIFKANGQAPDDTRSRCQIIPPRVPQFPKLG